MAYTSPGGAFSNSLDDFLVRQDVMKRQAQMDALAQQREARMTADADEDRALRREEMTARREDLIARAKEREVQDVEKRITGMLPGDIPDPEMLKHADKLGIGGQAFPKAPESLPGVAAVPLGREQVGVVPSRDASVRPFIGAHNDRVIAADNAKQAAYIKTLPPGQVRTAAEYELNTGKAMPTVAAKTDPHSPMYTEYQDYANEEVKAGRTPMGFNDYATMDANRKKPTASGDGAGITAATIDAMGPAGFDMLAKNMAKGQGMPPFGMMGKGEKIALITALTRRAAQYNEATNSFMAEGEVNPNVPDLTTNKALVTAETSNITELRKSLSGIRAFASAADKNFQRLDSFVGDIPDFGVSWANKPARAVAQAFGSTKMTDYNVLQNSLKSEYTRLINQAKLSGVAIPESARAEMDRGVDTNATIPQIRSAFQTLKAESINREQGMEDELTAAVDRLGGKKPAAKKSKYKVTVSQ